MGYVMDRLYNAGAREVNYMPVFMKKNRPGWLITVICKEENIKTLENIIFAETTTIGIRRQKMERTILKEKFPRLSHRLEMRLSRYVIPVIQKYFIRNTKVRQLLPKKIMCRLKKYMIL